MHTGPRWLTYKGETKSMSEWARITGFKRETLRDRIDDSGWTVEEAIETPIYKPQGLRTMKEHKSWEHIKQRCFNPNFRDYHRYGGRGITICQEWLDDFWNFYNHIGPAPGKGRYWSVDRINNEGHYEPGNVRWATPKIQGANRAKKFE